MRTDMRKGRLPFAPKASEGYTLNFKGRRMMDQVRTETNKYGNFLPMIMQKAIFNPGVRQSYFFEENGYEYEKHATWNPKTETMYTTMYCPYYYNYHIGSYCSCCGQKD